MPRGSKPGERRGGRQKGTPNKKTVLRDAAVNAAAANPNLSPLDFLLGLMRNPDLPQHVRIQMAEVAAPFVHRKPTKSNPAILAPRKHVALMKTVRKGKPAQAGAVDSKAGTPGTLAAEGAEEDLSPLEYLMGVMRDPNTAAEVRVRIARSVVPFAHPKQKRDPKADQAEAELMEALGDEFMVDPELAAKIRDDERRLRELHSRSSQGPSTPAETEEKAALEARIEENAIAIGCPPGYGREQRGVDSKVEDRFAKKRNFPPPDNRLTEMELLLEAQAAARLAAYSRRPEKRAFAPTQERLLVIYGKARVRPELYKEEYQRLRASLPADLQAEHRDLDAPVPEPESLSEALSAFRALRELPPDLRAEYRDLDPPRDLDPDVYKHILALRAARERAARENS